MPAKVHGPQWASQELSVRQILHRTAFGIYILGVLVIAFFALQAFASPAFTATSREASQKQLDCSNEHNPYIPYPPSPAVIEALNRCYEQVLQYDRTNAYLSAHLADWYYSTMATSAWSRGETDVAVTAFAKAAYFAAWYYMTTYGSVPWTCWVVLGGYLFLSERIANRRKWITEGAIVGLAIVSIIATFSSRRPFASGVYWDGSAYVPMPTPTLSGWFVLVLFLLWISVDVAHRNLEHIVAKILILVAGYISFLVLPFSESILYVVIPLVTIASACAYHYWRVADDPRKQVSIILYTTILIGLVAAMVKHWPFISTKVFIGSAEPKDVAELVIDVALLLLGSLLTFLELGRRPTVGTGDSHAPRENLGEPGPQPPIGARVPAHGQALPNEFHTATPAAETTQLGMTPSKPEWPDQLHFSVFISGLVLGICLATLAFIKQRKWH